MAEQIDKEIDAIRAVLTALEPLTPEVRASVLGYVAGRLKIASPSFQQQAGTPATRMPSPKAEAAAQAGPAQKTTQVHIEELKNEKNPRSANEMAALVAYYLANEAPHKERKDKITTDDIETYFKIAKYPLPGKTQFTLGNAKAAGYLDAVGAGEYTLNPVGYNLVVHGLPRGANAKSAPVRRRNKQARKKGRTRPAKKR